MSYDLFNPSLVLSYRLSRQFWAKTLELARLYGWQPMGTRPPPGVYFARLSADWDGNYATNDGQVVSAEDATALANALERALGDIPDRNTKVDWDLSLWLQDDLPEWFSPEEKEIVEEQLQDGLLDIMGIHPLAFFAGEEKHYLVQFIKFCRLGSFEIL